MRGWGGRTLVGPLYQSPSAAQAGSKPAKRAFRALRAAARAPRRRRSCGGRRAASVVAGRHQRHVVEGRDQDAAVERVEVQVAARARGRRAAAASAPSRGGSGENRYSARQPSWTTCQGSAVARRSPPRPRRRSASPSGDHPLEGLVGRAPRRAWRGSPPARARCRPACRRRRPCPRSRRLARPEQRARRPRRSSRSAPAGTPPAIALPSVSMSGSRPQARACSRPGPAQSVWVSSMISSVPVARVELAQRRRGSRRRAGRCRCWSAPARRARRRRRRAASARSSAVEVVELDHPGRLRRVDRRPDVALARARPSPSAQRRRSVSSTVPW